MFLLSSFLFQQYTTHSITSSLALYKELGIILFVLRLRDTKENNENVLTLILFIASIFFMFW